MIGNHKTTLKDHSKSKNPIMLAPSYEVVVKQRQCLADLVSGSVLLADAVTEYEMTLVCFLIHQNLPISSIESTVSTLRRFHPTDDRLKKLQLGRTKTTAIIKDGFGVGLKLSLYEKLRKTFFSIVIDKTTDVKVQSQLAIMVQYWDAILCQLVVDVLEFIVCRDPSADGLSKSILTLLEKQQIPKDWVVGFCTDTCSVIVREKEIGFNDSPRNDSVNCHHKMFLSFHPFGRVQCQQETSRVTLTLDLVNFRSLLKKHEPSTEIGGFSAIR
ncbi:uncharacterized protein LOC123473950 [Daphnia magna]|uniref:uncharacterized protein LOC123473948 n=1 Tax=Daphnia magna TaxID=35525 RepID=UPI001E1BBDD5|nr:uncharacterized protein LOC123473948 [Daphnia magna]XP_045031540.1 uncharacterized protein LOC123473948 [Daphnia magna]XP_045031541.1 uncharacterized protein LOC116918540 [Daphnia magna]XP_045031542.1 uncharacterized protein LOC116918540 [Daphnia magna]XP_045031543.1 uncharacterized protein LOC123473950 [Daphnia magna]XP_045031544.1 uncharacterized protein LOC123473950 [Daphnia magna]